MNIHALSLKSVNLHAPSAPPASAARLPAAVSKEADNGHDCDGTHRTERPNRLTQALSAALREIGIGGTPGKAVTPATTDTAAGATATSMETSVAAPSTGGDISAAVEQFASALMDALGAGRVARGRSGEHRQDGEHGHHGHGPHNRRYGDFAQRLESLSTTMVQTPPTAPAAPAPAIAAASVTKSPLSLPPVVETDISGATPAPASSAPAPSRPAPSPLLEAFTRLFDALKPRAAADAPATDMASRLQQFLHTMAQSLSHAGSDSAAAPQAGAFVNLRA